MAQAGRSPFDSQDLLVRRVIDTYVAWTQVANHPERDDASVKALARHQAAVQMAQAAGIRIYDIRNYPEQERDNMGKVVYVDHYYAFGYEHEGDG